MTAKQRAWSIMAATFFASIVVAINRFKVPPVMQVLMDELDIGMATGGWLMSVTAVAAIALALPSAFLINRFGPKTTGLVALGCTIAGTIVGALAPNLPVMLLGRTIEGVGIGLIAVVAPVLISMWFAPQERGLPMGMWSAWVPIGNVIMFNLAHPLLDAFGWQAVWWFGAAVALLAFVLFGLVVQAPPPTESEKRSADQTGGSIGTLLFNPSSWLLAFAFGAFGFSLIGYNTWAPSFLSENLGIDDASASFYASLMFLAAIPANMFAGWVINRTEHRNRLLAGAFVVSGLLFLWGFSLPSVGVAVLYMIALGFTTNIIPASIFTLAPETMPSLEFAGLALAILAIGSGLGRLTGPPVIGSVVSGGNWSAGNIFATAIMACGATASILLWRRMRSE